MRILGITSRAALAAALVLSASAAFAQTVTQQPQFAAPRTVLDVGNGPTEFRMISGSMSVFTSQGTGTAGCTPTATTCVLGTSSTTLPLSATPSTVPLVGGIISGTGITSGTTVSAFDTTTNKITLSSAMTVSTGAVTPYGAACPSVQPTAAVAQIQAGVGADLPFFTQARICAWGGTGPGGQFTTFTIGAH